MVAVKAASNSSVSSSTSSVSSGVTSTVQRTRHIPISIASAKKPDPSAVQLRRPSPKQQSTIRIQMNEFSVDFGNGQDEPSTSVKTVEKNGEKKTEGSLDKRSPSGTSLDKKSPSGTSLDKKPAEIKPSGLRRPSTGSISSDKKSISPDKKSISSDKKSISSDKKSTSSDKKSISSDKKSPSITLLDKKSSTPPTQRPSISSIGRLSGSQKSTDKEVRQKSVDENAQQVVVAEIHQPDEVPAVNDETESKNDALLREPSHEEEYKNSQTSDSIAGDEVPEVKEDAQETQNPDEVQDTTEDALIITEQQNEIEVDVAESKQEEGQITTKIILDSQCRAIAAQDLEIEIRREIHTEVSPPISPEPPHSGDELKDKEDEEIKIPEKVQENENDVQEAKEVKDPRSQSEQKAQDSTQKPETKSQSVPIVIKKEEEPELKPFIFKESQVSPQQFRDVSVRIESVEPEKRKTPIIVVEDEDKKLETKEEEIQDKTQNEPDAKEIETKEEEVQDKIQNEPDAKSQSELAKKSLTPMEEVKIDVEKRKKSDADLAEVRVYRERYSEAPILPYPTDKPADSTTPRPRVDLSSLNKRPGDQLEKDNKAQKRPVITPISPAEKSIVHQQKVTITSNQPHQDLQKESVGQRPRIISQDGEVKETKIVDEEVERQKREPIRLNIASSLHSPPATSPHSPPSQYENRQNGTTYPSNREINGLYRPHPLYPQKDAATNFDDTSKKPSNPPSAFVSPTQSTTKLTTKTTIIATNVEPQRNGQATEPSRQLPDERLQAASPELSGRLSRLSAGTGERSDNDFTPRTLSRINHLNVIMECGSEKGGAKENDAGEVITHHPIFMKDTSKYWYKPTISREEAIAILKDKEPGTFVVRDSNSFPGAFGLALKVAQAPAGVQPGDGTELVRHFLIEPSAKGVKLKGCTNEPVFGTLAALIYQHSITPLALPAKLILPDYDPASTPEHLNANQALLERGAACNVTYICSLDTESLTGPEAVRRAVSQGQFLLQDRALRAVPVHFKVSSQGITLTDNTRSLFFRRHYPVTTVTFAGIDPESRLFDNNNASQLPPTYIRQAPMFGFVARKSPSSLDNTCHVFAELDPEQPASAVVRFITNVMLVHARAQQQQIHRAVAGV